MWFCHSELPFHLFTWTMPPNHFFLYHPWLLFLLQLVDHIWFSDLIAYYEKQKKTWMLMLDTTTLILDCVLEASGFTKDEDRELSQ